MSTTEPRNLSRVAAEARALIEEHGLELAYAEAKRRAREERAREKYDPIAAAFWDTVRREVGRTRAASRAISAS